MKKHIKRLSLNKSTISNLNAAEMDQKVGGKQTNNCVTIDQICTRGCGHTVGCYPTQNGHTCNGNNC
jgi:hypothetical protein